MFFPILSAIGRFLASRTLRRMLRSKVGKLFLRLLVTGFLSK